MKTIERVARAIHQSSAGGTPKDYDGLREEIRRAYEIAARMAIAAMRHPSAAMVEEGNRRDMGGDAANVWERMLFRALNED
ncbi:hypothetical protein [Sphingomonas sp.]|uniref:hypothetical protein n=1 Tax=Sphingomonas sp. TaxID=28214 RepID=UPI003B006D59